ncbi:MAG: hypothetical protein ABI882_23965, partial [Acidobacteriota bacterium]
DGLFFRRSGNLRKLLQPLPILLRVFRAFAASREALQSSYGLRSTRNGHFFPTVKFLHTEIARFV